VYETLLLVGKYAQKIQEVGNETGKMGDASFNSGDDSFKTQR
jgi:hypothetical protein